MSRLRQPPPGRGAARAALTVVLPTPPFPATMTSRDAAKNRAGSTDRSDRMRLTRLRTLAGPSSRPRRRSARVLLGPSAGAAAGQDDPATCRWSRSPACSIRCSSTSSRRRSTRPSAGAVAVVLQLDSSGAVVADDRLDELVAHIEDAEVPVDVWVGPSGAGPPVGPRPWWRPPAPWAWRRAATWRSPAPCWATGSSTAMPPWATTSGRRMPSARPRRQRRPHRRAVHPGSRRGGEPGGHGRRRAPAPAGQPGPLRAAAAVRAAHAHGTRRRS